MHQFKLPYHLIVDDGIFSRVPEVMEDVLPGLSEKKTILVTEENLKGIFENHIAAIEKSFPNSELYLIQSASYDNAVALAKYITMNDKTII